MIIPLFRIYTLDVEAFLVLVLNTIMEGVKQGIRSRHEVLLYVQIVTIRPVFIAGMFFKLCWVHKSYSTV